METRSVAWLAVPMEGERGAAPGELESSDFEECTWLILVNVRRFWWTSRASLADATGAVADRYPVEPILIGARIIPLFAMLAVLVLVRNNEATRRGLVSEI